MRKPATRQSDERPQLRSGRLAPSTHIGKWRSRPAIAPGRTRAGAPRMDRWPSSSVGAMRERVDVLLGETFHVAADRPRLGQDQGQRGGAQGAPKAAALADLVRA